MKAKCKIQYIQEDQIMNDWGSIMDFVVAFEIFCS